MKFVRNTRQALDRLKQAGPNRLIGDTESAFPLQTVNMLVAERAGKELCVVVPDVDVDVEGESVFFQTHGCAQKSRRRPLFRAGGLSPSS